MPGGHQEATAVPPARAYPPAPADPPARPGAQEIPLPRRGPASWSWMRVQRPGAQLAILLGLAAAYATLAWLGLSMAKVHPSVSAVWPAAGLAVAVALLFGPRALPAIALGALAANLEHSLATGLEAGVAWRFSLIVAIGNAAEAYVAVVLLRAFVLPHRDAPAESAFGSAASVIGFAAVGLACSTVAATVGTIALATTQEQAASLASIWGTWWVGDAMGILAVAPVVILWAARYREGAWTARHLAAEVSWMLLATCAGLALFVVSTGPLVWPAIPLVLFIAAVGGARPAAVATAILSMNALAATVSGMGPFAPSGEARSLLLLQSFVGFTAVTSLAVAAVAAQRRELEASLRKAHADLEVKVRERTRRLEEAQAIADVGDWEWDLAEGRISWSPQMYAIHGVDPATFRPDPTSVRALIVPEDWQAAAQAVGATRGGVGPFTMSYRIRRPDGAIRSVHAEGRVVELQDGQPKRLVGTLQDVTERTETERSLRETQRLARLASYEWELATGVAKWSPEAFVLYDQDPAVFQPTLDSVMALVYEEDRPRMRANTEALLAGHGEGEGIDFRITTSTGMRWLHRRGTVQRDAQGKPLRMVGTVQDITYRKLLERSVSEHEERFRVLVEGTRDYAIFMLDPKGHILTWNLGAQRIKGYEPDEIVGRHFSIFYPPEDIKAGKPQKELEVAAWTGRYEEEGLRIRKDGTRFWASVVITALHDDEGELRGYGKVTRDITDRRAAEAQQRELERLSQFWALKNNVTARGGEVAIPIPPVHDAALARLEGSVDRLTAIVGQLADRQAQQALREAQAPRAHPNDAAGLGGLASSTRPVLPGEAGTLVQRHDVDLSAIVHEAVDEMQPAAWESGLRLDASIAGPLRVVGESTRLAEAVRHLVTVVIHETAAGGEVRVDVTADAAKAGRNVLVRLKGATKGLRRAGGPTDEVARLGLEVARAIIEQHGGSLLVQADAQQGGLRITASLPRSGRHETMGLVEGTAPA